MDFHYSLLVCGLCTLAGIPTITGHGAHDDSIHNTDLTGETHPPPRPHLNRNGIIDFVIHRGCMYMSGYVRSNYANDGRMDDQKRFLRPPIDAPSSGKGCSWENYVRSLSDTFHIPTELRDALIDCGSKYSFSALHMPQPCGNASYSNSLSALFGKRNSPSMIHIDKDEAKRNDDNRDTHHDDNHNSESMDSTRISLDILHNNNTALPPFLNTWCQDFSRSVRISHRFRSSNFANTGNNWILDVYRLTNIYKMPKFYAHCFVGCGLKYVLYGFHVPLWQSLVYIQQLN